MNARKEAGMFFWSGNKVQRIFGFRVAQLGFVSAGFRTGSGLKG